VLAVLGVEAVSAPCVAVAMEVGLVSLPRPLQPAAGAAAALAPAAVTAAGVAALTALAARAATLPEATAVDDTRRPLPPTGPQRRPPLPPLPPPQTAVARGLWLGWSVVASLRRLVPLPMLVALMLALIFLSVSWWGLMWVALGALPPSAGVAAVVSVAMVALMVNSMTWSCALLGCIAGARRVRLWWVGGRPP